MHRVVSDYTRVDDTGNSNIQVFVRARPLEVDNEASDFMVTDPEDSRKLIIKDPEASHKRYGEVSFQFDRVFWTNTKQEDVFNVAVKTSVDHVMSGFNSCTFACTTYHIPHITYYIRHTTSSLQLLCAIRQSLRYT
jgi:hypothetical protein